MKRLFTAFLVILLFVSCVACGKKNDRDYTAIDFYSVTLNDEEQNYSYTFKNMKGKVLFEKKYTAFEPEMREVTPFVYELLTAPDMVFFSNWAVYCDVKNSETSQIFNYVLGAADNYVVWVSIKENERFLMVDQLFDKGEGLYHMEYKLENATADVEEFIVSCEIDEFKAVTVTYLTGNGQTQTSKRISLP